MSYHIECIMQDDVIMNTQRLYEHFWISKARPAPSSRVASSKKIDNFDAYISQFNFNHISTYTHLVNNRHW